MSGEASQQVQHRTRKRLSCDAFPCPVGVGLMCNAECRDAIDRCEAVICLWLPVYRQAVADHKCARLLRVFERRAEPTLARALDYYYVPGLEREQFGKLVDAIDDALREAGL